MFKKLLLDFALLVILIIAALVAVFVYGLNYVNSTEFADTIKNKIKSQLNTDITFSEHSISFNHLILKNITIPNPKAAVGENLLAVEEVKLTYSLMSFYQGRYEVSEALITKPVIKLRQSKEGSLILPVDLAQLKTTLATAKGLEKPAEVPLSFSLPNIKVVGAEVECLAEDGATLFKAENANILASYKQQGTEQSAQGDLTINVVTVMPGLKITNVKSPLKFEKDILSLTEIMGSIYNGSLKGNVTLNTKASPMTYETKVDLDSVDMSALMADVGSDAQTLLGRLQLDFTGKGNLDAPKEVIGSGSFKISEAQVPKLKKLQLLGNLAGVSALKEGKFEHVDATYQIAQQKVQLAPLSIRSPNLNITMNGPVGFDKSLNLNGVVQLDPTAIQLLLNLAGLKSEDGKSLPVEVKGTTQEPKVSISGKLIDDILAMDPAALINKGTQLMDQFFKTKSDAPTDPNAPSEGKKNILDGFNNPFKKKTQTPEPTPAPAAP